MIFENRRQAGELLANRTVMRNQENLVVLGIPRGGVVVAYSIAQRLRAPLDVWLTAKLGVPGQEELAFGAVCQQGDPILNADIIRATGLHKPEIDRIIRAAREVLERRAQLFRGGLLSLDLKRKQAILVDDGIATGSSMVAAIRGLRSAGAARITIAVPVAPASTAEWLSREVEELICLTTPPDFYAVGQFYRDFSEVSEEEVSTLLHKARTGAAEDGPIPPTSGFSTT